VGVLHWKPLIDAFFFCSFQESLFSVFPEVASDMLSKLSWPLIIVLCLTLGLAPYFPQPHVLEKLAMLWRLELSRPIDIFDLVMHGAPWLLLVTKIFSSVFS